MKKQISIGMFGFGKTGKEVVNQLLQDPEVELCWIVRGSHTAEDERNCEDTPVYVAKEIDILKLLNSQPVDFIVDFSNSDTCMTYAPIAAKLKNRDCFRGVSLRRASAGTA